MKYDIEFFEFSAELSHYFESINAQWIEDMFVLEDIDKKVLQQPQEYIIDKGGKVWFAKHSSLGRSSVGHSSLGIVGTCALLNKGDGYYELTKMGVTKSARGLKVGEQLLRYVIDQSLAIPVRTLFLLTNAKCEAAIHLYEKNGFVHDREIMQQFGQSYDRCNVAMRYVNN